jgi:hypothetical protein
MLRPAAGTVAAVALELYRLDSALCYDRALRSHAPSSYYYDDDPDAAYQRRDAFARLTQVRSFLALAHTHTHTHTRTRALPPPLAYTLSTTNIALVRSLSPPSLASLLLSWALLSSFFLSFLPLTRLSTRPNPTPAG